MKQVHHPHDVKLYAKGANRDIDDDLMSLAQAQYIDACNMRTLSMDGDNASIKKINGEVVLYPNVDNRCTGGTGLPLSSTYECITSLEVNGNLFEIWADAAQIEPSLIRVNGQIVLMSVDFPAQAAYPMQNAKNESCIGGEVYVTDYKVLPMIYNIKDLLLNSGISVGDDVGVCTEKYFSNYNHQEHVLVLTRALNHPMFIKLDSNAVGYDYVFGATGLPVGYNTYSFRYASADGDRTAWSAPTPQIPIVKTVSAECDIFPSVKTISKDPDISSPSVYGCHIKFRIDNIGGYDFVEIRRDSWNVGDPLSAPAVSDIIGLIDIVDAQFGVVNVLDRGGFEETLTIDDSTSVMAALERAKAIRYFNQRLYLMNIEYASRDIAGKVEFIDEGTPDVAFATIEGMGKVGHSDPHKAAYLKSSMRGEKIGWAVVMWDEQGQNSYAAEVDGAGNLQMPNRREETSALTEGTSYFGTVKAANTSGAVSQTHEVFDLEDAIAKTDKCLYANIIDVNLGGKLLGIVNMSGCVDAQDEFSLGGGAIKLQPNDLEYKRFTPVDQDSQDCRYHNYMVNLQVKNDVVGGWDDYAPEGFEPNYFSAGTAFKGITTKPSWARGFSMVRTKPAGRVVAQGLGYYSMKSAGGSFGANTSKRTNEFAIHFPDLDASTGIDPSVVDAIKADPTAFSIQLVSPMGFFSEVFSFDNYTGGTRDDLIDMITYCRILKDNGEINPSENPNMGIDDGGGDRYVAYGKWRADSQFSPKFLGGDWSADLNTPEAEFDIDEIIDYTSSSTRMKYFRVRTVQHFYGESFANGQHQGDTQGVQDWHEPVYAVNIIRKVADIADTNVQQYCYTGHYQKFESVIGISDGTDNQIYELVDERWEDCINSINGEVQNAYSSLEKFAYIRDSVGNETRWLNVTSTSAFDLAAILNDLQAFGVSTVTDTSGSYAIYGVYKHQQSVDYTAQIFELVFDWFNLSYDQDFFLPTAESDIIIKYDNRVPIRVFGGDTWINEATWAVKDKVYNKGANRVNDVHDDGDGQGDNFSLNIAFPYRRYKLNPRIYIANKTTGLNRIQNSNDMRFNNGIGTAPAGIRQLISMWTAETRVNLSFAFNDEAVKHSSEQNFTLKNYVMRPNQWDDTSFGGSAADVYSDNNIFTAYETEYDEEFNLWGMGGFRFLPQTNIDYSKKDTTKGFTSTPRIGYEEQNLYCTRVIYSAKRPINVQDTPTVRTFPEENTYDLGDDTGEIKFAWSADSGKGNNLYAFTESGIALLLVDKRIVNEINGNELATVSSDIGGILQSLWLEREIGMSDEMWRSAAEYSNAIYWGNNNSAYMMKGNKAVDIGRMDYHSKLYPEYLELMGEGYSDHVTGVYDVLHDEYWINFKKNDTTGVESHSFITRLYLVDDTYGDADYAGVYYGLGEDEYLTLSVSTDLATQVGLVLGGYPDNNMLTKKVCIRVAEDSPHPLRVTDSNFNELVIIQLGDCLCFTPVFNPLIPKDVVGFTWEVCEIETFGACPTLVFGQTQQGWQGGFDYTYDKYVSFDNKTYGMRDMETYLLDEGRIINGELINAHVVHASTKNFPEYQYKDKEFIRIRINSDNKPTSVEFFNLLSEYLDDDPQALLDTILNPLHLKDYYGFEQYIPRKTAAPHNRMQGRLLIFKIIHNLDEDFRLSSTDIQFKPLK